MRYEPYIFKETIFSLGNVKNTVHEISYPWLSLMTSRLRRWKHKTSTPPFKCDKVGSMGASVVFLFNPKDNRPSSLASRIIYIAPSIGVPTSWSLLPATSSFIPHPDLKRMRDNLSIIDLTHSLLVNLELSCNSISSFPPPSFAQANAFLYYLHYRHWFAQTKPRSPYGVFPFHCILNGKELYLFPLKE